jgi:hypothetical protein
METCPTEFVGRIPTKFVGRISLSAESLRIQFIFGRYGNLPYVGVCSMETCPTALLLGEPHGMFARWHTKYAWQNA